MGIGESNSLVGFRLLLLLTLLNPLNHKSLDARGANTCYEKKFKNERKDQL